MIRLFYMGLAGLLTFIPVMVVWASEAPPSTRTTATSGRSSSYGSTYIYHSGGRGGWLSNSYGWGNGGSSADTGGSSSYRGGGPSGGGK